MKTTTILAVIVAALAAGCGGGDNSEDQCFVPLILLPDGRELLAPHNCQPWQEIVPINCRDTPQPEECS